MTISDVLRREIASAGITPAELATRAELPPITVNRYLDGAVEPSASRFLALLRAAGVESVETIADLVDEEASARLAEHPEILTMIEQNTANPENRVVWGKSRVCLADCARHTRDPSGYCHLHRPPR